MPCIADFSQKRFLEFAFIISSILVFICRPSIAFADEKSDFCYTIINGEASIIGFEGEPVYIAIPDEIEGVPVTEIRDNAFYECRTLKQILLPETIKKIGHHCFYKCSALEGIELPECTSEIGMGCFSECSSLSYAVIPDSLEILPDSCFRNCTSLTEIIIPQNVTEIEKFCFSGCNSLSDVSLSGRTNEIGDYAFFMCNSLKKMYVPESVKIFGTEAIGFTVDESGHSTVNDFSLSGVKNSSAEKYANENSINFSCNAEAVPAFSLRNPDNAPIEIPKIFAAAGAFFFIIACTIAVRQHFRNNKQRH
jgi:cell surface protein